MSIIQFKIITNQFYEALHFDGLSLSVKEVKKLVIEKKFGSSTVVNRKLSDFDLEISNLDTNQVYKNEDDLIPKNSRIQVSRVIRNSVPVKASSVSTTLVQPPRPQQQSTEKPVVMIRKDLNKCPDKSQSSGIESNSSQTQNLDQYDQISDSDSEDSKTENKQPSNELTCQFNKQPDIPPADLLCPFEDKEKRERHLIIEAVVVSCCGYFICCRSCLCEAIAKQVMIECPYPGCSQEITTATHLTPHYAKRQKIEEYLNTRQPPSTQQTFPSDWFTDSVDSVVLEKVVVESKTKLDDRGGGGDGIQQDITQSKSNGSSRVCENGKQFLNIRNLRFNPNFKATSTTTTASRKEHTNKNSTVTLDESSTSVQEPVVENKSDTYMENNSPPRSRSVSSESSRSSVSDISSVTSSERSEDDHHDIISIGSNSDVSDDEEELNYRNSLNVKTEPITMEEDSPVNSQFNTPSFDSISNHSSGHKDLYIPETVVEYQQDDISTSDNQFDSSISPYSSYQQQLNSMLPHNTYSSSNIYGSYQSFTPLPYAPSSIHQSNSIPQSYDSNESIDDTFISDLKYDKKKLERRRKHKLATAAVSSSKHIKRPRSKSRSMSRSSRDDDKDMDDSYNKRHKINGHQSSRSRSNSNERPTDNYFYGSRVSKNYDMVKNNGRMEFAGKYNRREFNNYYHKDMSPRESRPPYMLNKWSPHGPYYDRNERNKGFFKPESRNLKYYNGYQNWKKRPDEIQIPPPRYQNRYYNNESGYRNEPYRVNNNNGRFEYTMQNNKPYYKRMNEGHFQPHYIRYESAERRRMTPEEWLENNEFRKDYHHSPPQGFGKPNEIRNLQVTLSKESGHRMFSSNSSSHSDYIEREGDFRPRNQHTGSDEMQPSGGLPMIKTSKRNVYLKADMAAATSASNTTSSSSSSSQHHNFPAKNNSCFSYANKDKNTEPAAVVHHDIATESSESILYKSIDHSVDQIEGYDVLDIMVSERDNLL